MTTLITGGTGFIGSHLVRALLAQGEDIHLLCRSKGSLSERHAGRQLKVFYGDVTDRESIAPAVRGCRQVFHLAGYARNWARDRSAFARVNVDGFSNVAELAVVNGVDRMVLTSSVVTLGPTNTDIGNENMGRSRDSFFTEYERTKYLAEVRADQMVTQGLPLVTVLPTRVYGPGKLTEGNAVTIMAQKYLAGKFPIVLSRGEEIGNYVYVDHVVDGHLKAMSDGVVGQKYILGGENCSLLTPHQSAHLTYSCLKPVLS